MLKAPLEDPDATCKLLFGRTPYSYQERINNAVFVRECKKITIRATTRAGKSFNMAEIGILKATFKPNHRVGIIAPTHPKTRIIMNYVADLLAGNTMFDDAVMVSTEGLTTLERLRKEVSKNRITFRNGSSIEGRSVDLDSRGFGALGFAYQTIIVDETDLIDDESYAMIYRMLVESQDAQIIEIGNPWRLAHFYQHHHSDEWEKIHISWQECVAAGRMTREAVEDQKREITQLEFQVLFEAEFPEEIEMAIFSKDAINELMKIKPVPEKIDRIIIGIDPAAGGRDRTVLTAFAVKGNEYWMLPGIDMDERDAMKIVGRVREFIAQNINPNQDIQIAVDCVNNRGVHDRLKEFGYSMKEFIAGKQAREHKRFYNTKTEIVFKMAEIAKKGLIHNVPPNSKYILQLRAWTFEVRSDKQLKVIDPEEKSPDFADSMSMALFCDIYHDDPLAVGISGIRPMSHRGTPMRRDRLHAR